MFQPALELQDTSGTNRLDRKFIIIKEEAGERAPKKMKCKHMLIPLNVTLRNIPKRYGSTALQNAPAALRRLSRVSFLGFHDFLVQANAEDHAGRDHQNGGGNQN